MRPLKPAKMTCFYALNYMSAEDCQVRIAEGRIQLFYHNPKEETEEQARDGVEVGEGHFRLKKASGGGRGEGTLHCFRESGVFEGSFYDHRPGQAPHEAMWRIELG